LVNKGGTELTPITFIKRYPLPLFGMLAALAVATYLLSALYTGGLGFPLDDAWIHQTYARNLAQTGQFAYLPGRPSVGSTAPLWTILLSLGYALRLPYLAWSYFLGWLCLTCIGWIAWRLVRRLFSDSEAVAVAVGFLCTLEWHLVWAACSGMETALFTLLALLAFDCYLSPRSHTNRRWEIRDGVTGFLGSLLTLARPEGLLLVVLLGLDVVWTTLRQRDRKALLIRVAVMSLGLAVLIAPYIAFHWLTSGQALPNTFYAKQAEYREARMLPFWFRLWRVLLPTLAGPQALLLPGFIYALYHVLCSIRKARIGRAETKWGYQPLQLFPTRSGIPVLPFAWWLMTVLLYAIRLPVTYQHGRYLIPIIPVWLLYGAWGTAHLLRLESKRLLVRALGRALLTAIVVVTIAFLGLGARAYAIDVRIIQGEMVTVALWLAANTPPDALIAAHDIGALGYFAHRDLLDLAGLISPEVIHFIRDESRLWQFIQERRADYLVTFPSWYPEITQRPELRLVFQTDNPWTRAAGGEGMAVYLLSLY